MSQGKIVSIHSFRGGTGKSNTTANLAAQAALAGKRVAIVDTDIQSPGIHVLFGLDENKMGKTLNDFLHGKCSIVEVALNIGEHAADSKGRAQLKGKDIWLLPSSIRGREISQIIREGYDVNLLNEGFQTIIKELSLDYLFIDSDHTPEFAAWYVEKLFPRVKSGMIVSIHDVYHESLPSKEGEVVLNWLGNRNISHWNISPAANGEKTQQILFERDRHGKTFNRRVHAGTKNSMLFFQLP